MTAGEIIPSAAPSSERRMECMELWGGSHSTDTAVAMTGLRAHVFSQAHGEGTRGGDVYYCSSCASGRISRVLLADVSGHGAAVAEVAEILRSVMRRNVNVIRQQHLVAAINQEFSQITEAGGFATAVVVTYFLPRKSLTVSLAGHPAPLLFRRSVGKWELFPEETAATAAPRDDLPLGIRDTANYSSTSITFEPGDLLLAYTDAFTESVDSEGRMLQTEGLLKLINTAPAENRADIIPWLVDRLREMSGNDLSHDDATLILMEPTGQHITLKDNLLAPFRLVRGVTEERSESLPPR